MTGVGMRLDRYQPSRSLRAILCSAPVAALLKGHGDQIRARAASMYGATGYGCRVKVGKTRAHAVVYTGDAHAIRSNHLHNTLKKAVGGK